MKTICHKIEINGECVTLRGYLPDVVSHARNQIRPAVIVFPGGAYRGCADHEGEVIALQYVAAGACAFVLNYSVYPSRFPQALREAFAAIAFVREHAEEYAIQPQSIFVCGFSAGGHLAACTGTLWNHSCMDGLLEGDHRHYRPDGMILCYPVIGDRFHHGSMLNLFSKDEEALTEERLEMLSLERQVDTETPTAFLWHNFHDTGVPCESSLCFASALYRNGVQCECHLYSEGGHGCGLGKYLTGKQKYGQGMVCDSWMQLSIDFLFRYFEKQVEPAE